MPVCTPPSASRLDRGGILAKRCAFDTRRHTDDHHRGHTALGGRPPASRLTSLSGRKHLAERKIRVRAVVQRVSEASVTVGGQVAGAIREPGLLVLVGVTHDDTPGKAAKLAAKLWGLRILEGEKSCSDLAAPLLVISQFTLYADTRKGRRPTWQAAAPGPVAEPLVTAVVSSLRALGARVQTGVFGASMKVSLVNDGPVTFWLEAR
jgi:D-tyrosyl-tRNA(Tyr) deacylase